MSYEADEKRHLEHAIINAILNRPYDRNTVWRTHLGKFVKVKDMENNHLCNLVRFLEHYTTHPASKRMLPVLQQEMAIRQLEMPDFQVPYHDGEGNLIIWCFQTNRPKVVGKYQFTLRERFAKFAKKVWNAIKPDGRYYDDGL